MTADGRVARRERNCAAVLDAVVESFDAGHLDPMVDEVAELSGVSTRSIYRYFHHREGLLVAAVEHLVERERSEHPLELGAGPLNQRIRIFVAHRISAYRRIAPAVRAVQRLARAPGVAEVGVGGTPLLSPRPAVAFADDFARRTATEPGDGFAVISADLFFEFASLEYLSVALASDTNAIAATLERHLRQQLAGAD